MKKSKISNIKTKTLTQMVAIINVCLYSLVWGVAVVVVVVKLTLICTLKGRGNSIAASFAILFWKSILLKFVKIIFFVWIYTNKYVCVKLWLKYWALLLLFPLLKSLIIVSKIISMIACTSLSLKIPPLSQTTLNVQSSPVFFCFFFFLRVF